MTTMVHRNEQRIRDLIDQRLAELDSDKAEVKLKVTLTVRHGVVRRVYFECADEVVLE